MTLEDRKKDNTNTEHLPPAPQSGRPGAAVAIEGTEVQDLDRIGNTDVVSTVEVATRLHTILLASLNRNVAPTLCLRLATAIMALWAIVPMPLNALPNADMDQLRKNIDPTIAHARKYINEPGILADILDNLVPVADDPRVLSFYGEIVDKSTTTESMLHAVQLVRSVTPFYASDAKQRKKIVHILSEALRKGDEMLQLASYDAFLGLGVNYKLEVHKGYRRILSATYRSQDERRHKIICVRTIQSFIRLSPPDAVDIVAIQKATDHLGLLKFYQEQLFNKDSKSAEESSRRFLDQWLAILNPKATTP